MNKYKAIIYDVDGTILNTLDMNMYPLLRIIEEETGERWTIDQVLKFYSYPGMKVMEELNIKDPVNTYARWVKYVNEYKEGAILYDGFMEVFETFKRNNIKQAIVSAKRHKQYEIDICSKGIDKYMDAAILAEDTTKHKPDPEPLLKCLERLKLSSNEVIYIGDSSSDQEAANNASIDFGYAKWGSVSSFPLNSKYIFDKPIDLLKLIK